MTSEIRANTLKNRVGLGTIEYSNTGPVISGVTTSNNFKTGSTNVHSVGVEAAGINVLGADTPIGTGATIYNSGAAVFTGVVTATAFHGNGSNLTGLPSQVTISNNADNRVITGGSGTNLNGEANLTFDGDNTLAITGPEGGAARIDLISDEGDDAADKVRLVHTSGNEFKIQRTTSHTDSLIITSGGTVHTAMTGTAPSWLGNTIATREKFSIFQGANFGEACFNIDVDNANSFLSHNMYYSSGWKIRKSGSPVRHLEIGTNGWTFMTGADGSNDTASALTNKFRIRPSGRIQIANNDEDIDMSGDSAGQIQIDGNGYTGAIALNSQGMFLYHNSSSRYIGIGVNETEVGRFTTGGYEQRFVNTTTYSATSGARKGIYVFNDGETDGCYASLELGATDGDDHFGSTILNSIATGTNYSNDFAIQLRHSGNYYERLRIASDGDITATSSNVTQSVTSGAAIFKVQTTATSGDALIQASGEDSSGNTRMIQMRTDSGASQYRIISSDTSYSLALCTGNTPRIKIAGNSAATSIGGSNVFNAMLTVQGDISGQLLNLKATENTTRLMVSGSDGNGVEMNFYDDAGAQKGIIAASTNNFAIKATQDVNMQFMTNDGYGTVERAKLDKHGIFKAHGFRRSDGTSGNGFGTLRNGYQGDDFFAGPSALYYVGHKSSSSSSNYSAHELTIYRSGHWGQYPQVIVYALQHYYQNGFKMWHINDEGGITEKHVFNRGGDPSISSGGQQLVGSGTHGGQNVHKYHITFSNGGTYRQVKWFVGWIGGGTAGHIGSNRTVSQADDYFKTNGGGLHFVNVAHQTLQASPKYSFGT